MIRMYFIFVFSCFLLTVAGQGTSPDLAYYIEVARNYSPLLNDYRNQLQIEQAELRRLKALYTRSRIELNGDYLFVPVITKDGGQTSFRWNAQDAIDYYGYDLGESSGHLHAGATWTQPLLGHSSYKVAQELSGINIEITRNNIRIEENQLERLVTEQYQLCLLDQTQIAFADSIAAVLEHQQEIVRLFADKGLAKQSDLHLLAIEWEANAELRLSSLQAYHTHLMDLNLLCGIDDTTDVALTDTGLHLRLPLDRGSRTIPTGQPEHSGIAALFQLAVQATIGLVCEWRHADGQFLAVVQTFRLERGADVYMDSLRRQAKAMERTPGRIAAAKHTHLSGPCRIPTQHEAPPMPVGVGEI